MFSYAERRVKRPNVSEWHFWTKTSSTKFWHFLLLRCSRYHMRPYVLSWFVERIENEGRKAKHLLNPLFLIFLFYFWGKNQWQALNSSNPVRNSINVHFKYSGLPFEFKLHPFPLRATFQSKLDIGMAWILLIYSS